MDYSGGRLAQRRLLAAFTGRMSGSDWVGWQSIVNWVADINLGAVLIFVAWILYVVKKLDSD